MTIHEYLELMYEATNRLVETVPEDLKDGDVVYARTTYLNIARGWRERAEREGILCWRDVMEQHFAQVLAAKELPDLRKELIDLAGMTFGWLVSVEKRLNPAPERKPGAIEVDTLPAIKVSRGKLASGYSAIQFKLGAIPVTMAPMSARQMAKKLLELTSDEDCG